MLKVVPSHNNKLKPIYYATHSHHFFKKIYEFRIHNHPTWHHWYRKHLCWHLIFCVLAVNISNRQHKLFFKKKSNNYSYEFEWRQILYESYRARWDLKLCSSQYFSSMPFIITGSNNCYYFLNLSLNLIFKL